MSRVRERYAGEAIDTLKTWCGVVTDAVDMYQRDDGELDDQAE